MPRGDLQVTTRELPTRLADQALMLEFVAFLPCDPRDKELKDQRKRQANSAGSLCEVSRVRAAWPSHGLCKVSAGIQRLDPPPTLYEGLSTHY